MARLEGEVLERARVLERDRGLRAERAEQLEIGAGEAARLAVEARTGRRTSRRSSSSTAPPGSPSAPRAATDRAPGWGSGGSCPPGDRRSTPRVPRRPTVPTRPAPRAARGRDTSRGLTAPARVTARTTFATGVETEQDRAGGARDVERLDGDRVDDLRGVEARDERLPGVVQALEVAQPRARLPVQLDLLADQPDEDEPRRRSAAPARRRTS